MLVPGRRKRELSLARKRHTPDQVITKPGETDAAVAAGSPVAEAAHRIGATGQTFYRRRCESGGPMNDQAGRLKRLESENSRPTRAGAALTLDNRILREASGGYF